VTGYTNYNKKTAIFIKMTMSDWHNINQSAQLCCTGDGSDTTYLQILFEEVLPLFQELLLLSIAKRTTEA